MNPKCHPLLKEIMLTCGKDAVIKRIDFASLVHPPGGAYGSYAVNDACHHPYSTDYVYVHWQDQMKCSYRCGWRNPCK